MYAREAIRQFPDASQEDEQGEGATEPTQKEGWNMSKCSQFDLETLVSDGVLVPRSVINGAQPWGKIIRMKFRWKSFL